MKAVFSDFRSFPLLLLSCLVCELGLAGHTFTLSHVQGRGHFSGPEAFLGKPIKIKIELSAPLLFSDSEPESTEDPQKDPLAFLYESQEKQQQPRTIDLTPTKKGEHLVIELTLPEGYSLKPFTRTGWRVFHLPQRKVQLYRENNLENRENDVLILTTVPKEAHTRALYKLQQRNKDFSAVAKYESKLSHGTLKAGSQGEHVILGEKLSSALLRVPIAPWYKLSHAGMLVGEIFQGGVHFRNPKITSSTALTGYECHRARAFEEELEFSFRWDSEKKENVIRVEEGMFNSLLGCRYRYSNKRLDDKAGRGEPRFYLRVMNTSQMSGVFGGELVEHKEQYKNLTFTSYVGQAPLQGALAFKLFEIDEKSLLEVPFGKGTLSGEDLGEASVEFSGGGTVSRVFFKMSEKFWDSVAKTLHMKYKKFDFSDYYRSSNFRFNIHPYAPFERVPRFYVPYSK